MSHASFILLFRSLVPINLSRINDNSGIWSFEKKKKKHIGLLLIKEIVSSVSLLILGRLGFFPQDQSWAIVAGPPSVHWKI